MNHFVTVIIPTYNRANLIRRSVCSVLSQNFKNLELIVVDDGSTDDTLSVLSAINDSRLSILHQNHKGACAARNLGIQHASGDLIAFQDSDDVWLPNKLTEQISVLDSTGSEINFCMMKTFGLSKPIIVPKYIYSNQSDLYKSILGENCISTQQLIGLTSCFKSVSFDEQMPRFQDWDIVLRLIKRYSFSFTEQILVHQYLSSDSLSHNSNKALVAFTLLEKKHIDEYLLEPQRYAIFLKFKLMTCKSFLSRCQRVNEAIRINSFKPFSISLKNWLQLLF